MPERMSLREQNPQAAAGISAVLKHLDRFDPKLRALVEVRVSQINGCVNCLDTHIQDARVKGVGDQKLDCVAAYADCDLFDEREKAALDWAEALTHVVDIGAPDELWDLLHEHFSEQEIADLTMVIVMMNAWNRVGIAFQYQPEPRE